MARTYIVQTGPVTLTASATKSLILLNPTVSFGVTEVGVSLSASASSAPVQFDLYRTTTVGTPAGTVATFVRGNASVDANSANATASSLVNLTGEPTTVEILRSWYVQPFGGLLVVQFPLGNEPQMSGTSTNRIGLRYTTPAGVAPGCIAYLETYE